jgi:hypothetical protein
LLGWPAFVGVAIMIVSLPLNTFIARVLKKMQGVQMKNRGMYWFLVVCALKFYHPTGLARFVLTRGFLPITLPFLVSSWLLMAVYSCR